MTWQDFTGKVHQYFDGPRDEIQLGYRINGDARTMTTLTCDNHWKAALKRLAEKADNARTRAVTMEIKNMVSYFFQQ
jgi:hypothetical protein